MVVLKKILLWIISLFSFLMYLFGTLNAEYLSSLSFLFIAVVFNPVFRKHTFNKLRFYISISLSLFAIIFSFFWIGLTANEENDPVIKNLTEKKDSQTPKVNIVDSQSQKKETLDCKISIPKELIYYINVNLNKNVLLGVIDVNVESNIPDSIKCSVELTNFETQILSYSFDDWVSNFTTYYINNVTFKEQFSQRIKFPGDVNKDNLKIVFRMDENFLSTINMKKSVDKIIIKRAEHLDLQLYLDSVNTSENIKTYIDTICVNKVSSDSLISIFSDEFRITKLDTDLLDIFRKNSFIKDVTFDWQKGSNCRLYMKNFDSLEDNNNVIKLKNICISLEKLLRKSLGIENLYIRFAIEKEYNDSLIMIGHYNNGYFRLYFHDTPYNSAL